MQQAKSDKAERWKRTRSLMLERCWINHLFSFPTPPGFVLWNEKCSSWFTTFGWGFSVNDFQRLSNQQPTTQVLAALLGFTSFVPPTPKSLLLRMKARLEIVANEDVEADTEIWSNSCRNSCNQSVTREGSAENWRTLCVTTEGYKETPPPVTRNGEWRLRSTYLWAKRRLEKRWKTTSEVKGSHSWRCLWCGDLEHPYGIYWLNACYTIFPTGFLVLSQETS